MAVSRCSSLLQTFVLKPLLKVNNNNNKRTLSVCVRSLAGFKSSHCLENYYPNSHPDPYTLPPTHEYSSIDSNGKFTGFIPLDEIQMKCMKSSGPGGQNVNKVNTKVEVRFHVESATWIPADVRSKLVEKYYTRINKAGFLIVTSDRTRKQLLNQADCLQKVRNMIFSASLQPREPSQEELELKAEREARAQSLRIKAKREHSLKKQSRQTSGYIPM
ncbi:peptidyl-tRNA hydrolase ICT1, mitochondrial-like [Argonauta hians]